MNVFVAEFGTFIGKTGERLVVRQKGEVVQEIPFHEVEQVTIGSAGVSISSDFVEECCERGIQINFLSGTGRPVAKLTAPNLTGTVATRREQVLAFNDHRGVEISKAIIEGKIRNQINVARYFGKYRKSRNPAVYERVRVGVEGLTGFLLELATCDGSCIDDIREQLLSIEGRASKEYWAIIRDILGDDTAFERREHRGATDPFNCALNYGYGVLYSEVWGAIFLAGLEPFGGFLHVDRPGKPSLVLDMVEEFRQQVVDRAIVGLFTHGSGVELDGDGKLSPKSRRAIAQAVIDRLESREAYQGKQYKLKTILQMQSRRLASYLRGEEKAYKAFVGSW